MMARPEPQPPHPGTGEAALAAAIRLAVLDRATNWRLEVRPLWCEDFCADYREAE